MNHPVAVASENEAKIRAVGRALDQRALDLPFLRENMISMSVESGVSAQPTSLIETFKGAKNRAFGLVEKIGLSEHALYIGIESGVFELPEVTDAVLDICVVYLRFGEREAWGTSSGWMLPDEISALFVKGVSDTTKRYTLNDAVREAGLTDDASIGKTLGAVALLSGGLLSREDYTLEAVRNALFGMFPSGNTGFEEEE